MIPDYNDNMLINEMSQTFSFYNQRKSVIIYIIHTYRCVGMHLFSLLLYSDKYKYHPLNLTTYLKFFTVSFIYNYLNYQIKIK